ncbi:hypothetical protein MMC22_008106 [Lobaria immixta]|nr:hypothetical protein [Lobaria immixta]
MTKSNKNKKRNKKRTVNLTTSDQKPDADESMSRNGAVAKVISKPSGPGLLDLPPEIRLMIFRHLLVRSYTLDMRYSDTFVNLDILKTSKLIHKEAFDVFYKENSFDIWLWERPIPITRSSRVIDTIQSIDTSINLRVYRSGLTCFEDDMRGLTDFKRDLGNSITRRRLAVHLYIDKPRRPLNGLVRALARITCFRVVELRLHRLSYPDCDVPQCCEHLKTALEPVFGYAEEFESWGCAGRATVLRFHPIDHQNRSRDPDDGDCDYLDGIRLNWNETLADTDD